MMMKKRAETRVGEALGAIAMAIALTGGAALADVSSREGADTTADADLPREADGQSAELLSAFFGLDNGLRRVANRIYLRSPGKDGMPVIFSTDIDHTTLQAGDFQVTTQSGQVGSMHCASLLPATDAGELGTVLLVGEFDDADDDPPARVEIIGHLHSIEGAFESGERAAFDILTRI